ncbi:MAG: AAA family ATPase [Ardenticatenaceae bacterium]
MRTISGYNITEKLYESRRSLVYRATSADNQAVILKTLKEAYPAPETIAWFRREYEVTRQLDVAGVVDVYALERDQHRLVMVLEDFGGASLARLGVAGQLSLEEFLGLGVKVCDILGQIHAANVMHKDINPANIVLNPTTGQVKVIDFGISTKLSRENPTFRNPKLLEGTLAYLSPEQTGRMNRAMDYRTDFYSLGVTFYELLSGQLPFDSDDPLELVHSHIAKQAAPLHLLADVPRAISSIINKLMAKNASERYQSARGIRADLAECQRQLETDGQIEPFPLAQQDLSDRLLIPPKLYGREAERAELLAAFERVANGTSEIMLVVGYSGIGKSALVQEVYQAITARRGYYVAGKFEQFQRDIPYLAFRQAFQALIRQLLVESEAVVATWREKLLAALGSNGQLLINMVPEVALIIGPQPELPELGPTEARNRFNLVLQRFVNLFTQPDHPLVLFLDDLQWADRASLTLIQRLMTTANSRFLFLIGAYRDNEVRPGHPLRLTLDEMKNGGVTTNQIALSPLPLPDIAQLIADTLHCNKTSAQPLAQLVLDKSGGNPFFIRQFLKSLASESLITFDEPRGAWQWQLAPIQRQAYTSNVVEFMAGQVKKLPQQTQSLLSLAACIGNQFDLNTLAVVYKQSKTHTALDLWPAISQGLLFPLSDPYLMPFGHKRRPELVEGSPDPSALRPFDRLRAPQAVPELVEGQEPGQGTASGHPLDNAELSHEVAATYKFAHDRIQEAVSSLIPAADKQAVHLEVGRLLLSQLPTQRREERVFDLVNQLNQGRRLIENQGERDQLAELNLLAGRRASSSTAYATAFRYFQVALALLGEDKWQRQAIRPLTLTLHLEAAEAGYRSGNQEQIEPLIESVLHHAERLQDKAKAVVLRIEAYYAQHNASAAIQSGLPFLGRLGIAFPETPSQADIIQAIHETAAAVGRRSVEELAALPQMTDPEKLAAISILIKLISCAFNVMPNLAPLLTCQMVNLSLQYGNTLDSIEAYLEYGVLRYARLGDIEGSYQFGQLSLRLVEQFQATKLKPDILLTFNSALRHWKEPLRHTLPALQEAYQLGLEMGNFFSAAYALFAHTFTHAFYAGQELSELESKMADHRALIAQLNVFHAVSAADLFWQCALNLMRRAKKPDGSPYPRHLLHGEVYNAQKMLAIHQAANNKRSMSAVHSQAMILRYIFEEHEQAAYHANQSKQYPHSVVGFITSAMFYVYYSLIKLAVYPSRKKEEQAQILKEITEHQAKIKTWAESAPMNFLHKYYLIEAERARVLGQDGPAREYYDQAIDLAHENEYINEEALGYELAGKFYLAKGRTQVAHLYLRNAHYAYQRWGALSKVEQLEEKYPFLAQTARTERRATSSTITGTRATTTLDLESVLKANQAIAGEIHLAELLEKMIKIVIENAGAERGLLILEKGEVWMIEAQGSVESTQMMVRKELSGGMSRGTRETRDQAILPVPLSSDLLPLSIINYVVRIKKHVVLDEATQEEQFASDPYIAANRPKSILCMPLLNQGRVTAILYLENNLTTGAFTAERLEVLNLLSSQAAISLENARLYNTLEQRVKERTREAEEARAIAEEANRAKSTFLANMSHELRTPLNAILGFSQIMTRSRTLAKEHVENLGIISRSGEHLLTLINNVLDLSKIEAGKTTLNKQNFDLYRLLDDLEDMFQLPASEKRLQLLFERTPDVPRYVHTDSVKLRQVVINLLNNAIKFTDEGGVSVRVAAKGELSGATGLSFSVSDTGAGIAPEELDKLFEAFVQTEAGQKAQEGTGLGLPISRQFVKLMGGEMRVESQACADGGSIRRGTTFHFDIQVAQVEASDLQEARSTRRVIALEPNQPRYRILIVDDKFSNRELLIRLLNPLGFSLQEASNGQEAIEIWEAYSPHLIWMDMRMPVMDGYEATKRIKETPKGQATAIIALTASTFEEEQAVVLSAGCDDFLRKPFRSNDIFDMMHQHIGVRFVYDEDEASSSSATVAQEEALTPAALAALPAELLAQLQKAVYVSDIELTEERIAQISHHHPALAKQLTTLADEFEYDEILELIEEAKRL